MPPGYYIADMRQHLTEKQAGLRYKEIAEASIFEALRIRKEIKAGVDAEIEKLYPQHRQMAGPDFSVMW